MSNRIAVDIRVSTYASINTKWITRNISSSTGIISPKIIVVQPGFLIKVLTRKTDIINDWQSQGVLTGENVLKAYIASKSEVSEDLLRGDFALCADTPPYNDKQGFRFNNLTKVVDASSPCESDLQASDQWNCCWLRLDSQ